MTCGRFVEDSWKINAQFIFMAWWWRFNFYRLVAHQATAACAPTRLLGPVLESISLKCVCQCSVHPLGPAPGTYRVYQYCPNGLNVLRNGHDTRLVREITRWQHRLSSSQSSPRPKALPRYFILISCLSHVGLPGLEPCRPPGPWLPPKVKNMVGIKGLIETCRLVTVVAISLKYRAFI
jgi:hypothetical protein